MSEAPVRPQIRSVISSLTGGENENQNRVWECFMALAGVIAAVLRRMHLVRVLGPGHKKDGIPDDSATRSGNGGGIRRFAGAGYWPQGLGASPPAAAHPLTRMPRSISSGASCRVSTPTAARSWSRTSNGSTQEFKMDAKAKITKGGDFVAIALSDVKEGDHVTLGCRGAAVVSLHVKVVAAQ